MSRVNKPVDVFKYIKIGPPDVCWPFTGALNSQGRPYMQIKGKKVLVYRVVYELVKGVELERNEIIRHTCDNPSCCNPNHHIIGDHQENMNDMKERQRHGLPHNTVKAIRRLHAKGTTQIEIAELYGIGQSTVSDIITRKTYDHVQDE